jgi:hypothetical protein
MAQIRPMTHPMQVQPKNTQTRRIAHAERCPRMKAMPAGMTEERVATAKKAARIIIPMVPSSSVPTAAGSAAWANASMAGIP